MKYYKVYHYPYNSYLPSVSYTCCKAETLEDAILNAVFSQKGKINFISEIDEISEDEFLEYEKTKKKFEEQVQKRTNIENLLQKAKLRYDEVNED